VKQGAALCDAVIHTAFNHDFSKFRENCETDRGVIQALGSALVGTDKSLVVTSGIGLLRQARPVVESDLPPGSDVIPRAASEEAANAAAAAGVNVYIVRLPPTTHGKGDHGFVPILIGIAKDKKESVYAEAGNNHWPAVHRQDAATLYRLIVEKRPQQKVFHAVAESGIAFKVIAEAIGQGLHVPAVSKSADDAAKHFTWFAYFAAMDCQASSEKTREVLGWKPVGVDLIDDLTQHYF
jgi:nucleoside-diphosphate-sugar epimerase